MKTNKNKKFLTATATIAIILLMTSITLIAIPVVKAAEFTTTAYLSFRPNPIGVGQTLLVNLWLVPSIPYDQCFTGIWVNFTKPDGTIVTIGPLTTEAGGTGATWFNYAPDKVGKWYVQFSFHGQTILGDYYKPSTSPKLELIVQEKPVPSWPEAALPTDYWERPVSAEIRDWWSISGDWLMYSYNASRTNYNPYSTGPNTAHIVWKRQWGIGGLVGGELGSQMYGYGPNPNVVMPGGVVPSPDIIMAGLAYINSPEGIHCIDIRTGKELWVKPGSVTAGQHAPPIARGYMSQKDAVLLSIGATFTKYFAFSGATWWNMTGTLTGTFADPYVYSKQVIAGKGYLIKWDTTKTEWYDWWLVRGSAKTFKDMIVWNVTYEPGVPDVIWGDVGVSITRAANFTISYLTAFNTETGAVLWNQTLNKMVYSPRTVTAADGKVFMAMYDRVWHAYDLKSGKLVWESEPAGYPWGAFWAYAQATAYGNVYAGAYDGVYCFDAETGKIKWKYSYPPEYGFEIPYPSYPFFSQPVIADGKLYIGNNEHTPSSPLYRGFRLHCINATTGKGIWNITGWISVSAIADGYLIGLNQYDSKLYCFGKGLSKTTVTAPDVVVPKGTGVVIKGTVLDMSPAQPGTPCVSKESMTTWMEYLHMQKPYPSDVKGVPVTLCAIKSDGTVIDIGTVTTNGFYGTFGYTWTPPDEGTYEIIARFAGDDSYGSSAASTFVTVGPASEPYPEPVQPEPPIDTTPTIIGAAIAIIIAVAIATLLILKKKP